MYLVDIIEEWLKTDADLSQVTAIDRHMSLGSNKSIYGFLKILRQYYAVLIEEDRATTWKVGSGWDYDNPIYAYDPKFFEKLKTYILYRIKRRQEFT